MKDHEFFSQEVINRLVADVGVAFWVFEIPTNKLYYNKTFYELIGYDIETDSASIEWFESILHPDDRNTVMAKVDDLVSGKTPNYHTECRVVKKNGEIIWILDSGKCTEVDENGNPKLLCGTSHDITVRKYNEEKLKLAMEFADFSIWEWDVLSNQVTHEDEYIKVLGYSLEEFDNDMKNWLDIIHKDDIERVNKHLDLCFKGINTSYSQKLRIRKGNGEYIWVHDVGKISEFDLDGNPLKIIGGRVNINELETAKIKLEDYQEKLEYKIQKRTNDLLQRDAVLLRLNDMSQKLIDTPPGDNFNDVVYECLNQFSMVGENSRFSIYRHKTIDNKAYCYLASNNGDTYKKDFTLEFVHESFKDVSINFASEGKFNENSREEFYQSIINNLSRLDLDTINYQDEYPTIFEHVTKNKILNTHTQDLSPKEFIFTKLQGVKSMLVAPINIANKPWGFIILDCFEEKLFSVEDEKTLTLVGSVLAQAIYKNEFEVLANEAIEHNRLMLDSIPLCCNLWQDGKNVSTNNEAVRLFDLESQEEYLEKFHLLSPEYQPDGQKSSEAAPAYVQEAISTGFKRFEWMHQKLNGELIPCEITLVRIPHRDHYYVSGCTRDLRELKALLRSYEETQEHLKQAHEEALLSSQAKSNFLANMSHEIRTPMNAISGMTDIILRDTTNDDINDCAQNIKRASDSLLSIINDVLDISKIESGKLDIDEGIYDLSDTLNDILTIANNRLQDKNLLFVTNFQHDLPKQIIGDDIRVKQIIVNILNNAIKFTQEGSITFDVKGEFAGGLAQLTFSVTDTGIGISKEDIKKLFIEFERVNTTKNRSIEGTGLGLAISKRLCEMMNGYFEVTSEEGVGSTFSVTIFQKYDDYYPLAQISEDKSLLVFESRELYLNSIKDSCVQLGLNNAVFCSSQSEFNEALHQSTFDFIFTIPMYLLKVQEMTEQYKLDCKIILLADTDDIKSKYDYTTIVFPTNTMDIANIINGKTHSTNDNKSINKFIAPDAYILIVDDNTVNLKVAQGLLSPYKTKIDTAQNGAQAVEMVKNNSYDLVFMDHMMPVMDGIDATIAIRKLDGDFYKNLPIIALTANAIVGTKEIFISEGMNDFIAKPIKLDCLNEALSRWLPLDKQISPDKSLENIDYIEAVELEKIKKIDIKSIDTKLGISLVGGDFNIYIDILKMYHKDGIKRVNSIANLFQTNQLLDFKIEVHALKSASASIGATDVSELARLLEDAVNLNDITYVSENTQEFLDEFNILLQNIDIALSSLIEEVDTEKEHGDIALFNDIISQLSLALDSIDISKCDQLLENLLEFSWNESENELILKVKDFVDSYEYDEAVELISEFL